MAKRRKITSTAPSRHIQGAPPTSTRAGASGNSGKGLLSCPIELQTEILDYFVAVTTTSRVGWHNPILPPSFLEQTDVLRSLSQVSLDYRRVFLPLLYETVNICVARRPIKGEGDGAFYKHAGDTLRRKMEGLGANPELASCVRKINVVLTRYQCAELIPLFTSTIAKFQNLHTLHVIHAHDRMTTALKVGFGGVTLSSIRLLVIPGYCHEILRSCPKVKSIWGRFREDASKIVTVIGKHCKEVEELRGFHYEENTLKRLRKAAPGLKTIGIGECEFDPSGELDTALKTLLPSFPNLCEIIICTDRELTGTDAKKYEKSIINAKAFLQSLPPRSGRKSLRLWHIRNYNDGGTAWHTSVDFENLN